jgi:hypothetical protein
MMSASEKRKPWRCNVCLVALFDDYNDALAHEGKCDARTTEAECDVASGVAMSTGASEAEPSEAHAGPSTPPNHENDAIPICPLCCDESLTSTVAVVLSACQHRSCETCLVRWMEREESSGRDAGPTCPFCRVAICEGDVMRILGRPFHPCTGAAVREATDDDEIDELTLHWINQNTVPCANCWFRIEKEDGCDLMECLCGYRFCYKCGAAGGVCNCNPGHVFLSDRPRIYSLVWKWLVDLYHNFLARNERVLMRLETDKDSQRHLNWISRILEQMEKEIGCGFDVWYIEIIQTPMEFYGRWRGWKDDFLRYERSWERCKDLEENCAEEMAHWEYSAENPSVCTFNGNWLFSSRINSRCIAMLTQQLEHERVCGERAANRNLERFYFDDWEFTSGFCSPRFYDVLFYQDSKLMPSFSTVASTINEKRYEYDPVLPRPSLPNTMIVDDIEEGGIFVPGVAKSYGCGRDGDGDDDGDGDSWGNWTSGDESQFL